jgi:hypothetical protein
MQRRQVVQVDQDAVKLARDFFYLVWNKGGKGYVDLPTRVNGHWNTHTIEWPEQELTAERMVAGAIDDEEDLYFSVCKFSENRRGEDCAMPTPWLWADLDEVTPGRCIELGVCPTVVWESSPGRFQALWLLDKPVVPWIQTQFNRALSHMIGADIGGWDITQVLRPPGSMNYKYREPWQVQLIWADGLTYHIRKMKKILESGAGLVLRERDTRAPASRAREVEGTLPALSDLNPRARKLLRTKDAVEGERSTRLWELECLLAEEGLSEDQIYALVVDSVWNKWDGLRNGERSLRNDIRRAMRRVEQREVEMKAKVEKQISRSVNGKVDYGRLGVESPIGTGWVDFDRLIGTPIDSPPWLIEGIWSAHSHGIIGGEPKTAKSTLAMAMALSVASGKPFLGEFDVVNPGPVLMVQEENDLWMVKDRMLKIAASYGIVKAHVEETKRTASGKRTELVSFPDSVPMRLLNNWGFNLEEDEHCEMLEAEIAAVRPAMVILDPLYQLLGRVDENRAHEVRPHLRWLTYLRYTYGCAMVVVHHTHKFTKDTASRRPGQKLAGTHIFHGWLESGMYVEVTNSEDAADNTLNLKIHREFRNVGAKAPLAMELAIGEPGDLKFDVTTAKWSATKSNALLDFLNEYGHRGVHFREVKEFLGMSNTESVRKRCENVGALIEDTGKKAFGHPVLRVIHPDHV